MIVNSLSIAENKGQYKLFFVFSLHRKHVVDEYNDDIEEINELSPK